MGYVFNFFSPLASNKFVLRNCLKYFILDWRLVLVLRAEGVLDECIRLSMREFRSSECKIVSGREYVLIKHDVFDMLVGVWVERY